MSSFSNILLQDWSSYHGLPPFERITPNLFEEALNVSMDEHLKEIASIVSNADAPTFENTVGALDRSGTLFSKVEDTFSNLCSSNGVPELQAVELKMAGPLAAHYNKIATFPGLFSKVDAIYQSRATLGMNFEQTRLTERFHLDFVRAGAKFSEEAQARYAQIVEELAELETKFTQNVMADEAEIYMELQTADDFRGLPADLMTAAKQAAQERGITAKAHADGSSSSEVAIITLSRSLVEPFLIFSERRDLREKAWRMWTSRGELVEERLNLPIAKRILNLRAEQAKMHGYSNYAEYATADTMAGSPQRVKNLLEEVWLKAKFSVQSEREELEKFIREHDSNAFTTIEPWDWRFYAEKVRQKNYNLDNSEVKPYFPLPNMITAIFDCAYKLFKLKFVLKPDWNAYHADVQVYEVLQESADGSPDQLVAVFLHDNYARPHKRSGAWMSSFRSQYRDEQGQRVIPIVINNNNFNKPTENGVALLSFDDAVTLFHEFGHGLHGMLSNVTYRRLAGTSVLRDFVELPSQLFEHWLSEREVLKQHARHFENQEPIPDELLQRLMAARHFNQGFQTVEYTSSALVDAAVHQLNGDQVASVDLKVFEQEELSRLGMPQGMVMRHRLPHFQHLFSGSSYAAAYYVYLWAEVLDADAFDAFLENGGPFQPEVAAKVLRYIYSAGNSQDPAELFRSFRGRDPIIEPMLKKKGLLRE
jgi:peptidyl-dipeptidase Dcp